MKPIRTNRSDAYRFHTCPDDAYRVIRTPYDVGGERREGVLLPLPVPNVRGLQYMVYWKRETSRVSLFHAPPFPRGELTSGGNPRDPSFVSWIWSFKPSSVLSSGACSGEGTPALAPPELPPEVLGPRRHYPEHGRVFSAAFLVLVAERVHPFPSRTRKLSSPAPLVATASCEGLSRSVPGTLR